MHIISSITIALPPILTSDQAKVIIPVGPVDLVNREPVVGRFEDSIRLEPRWEDIRSAASSRTLVVSVEGRPYTFEVLNSNGTFMLIPETD